MITKAGLLFGFWVTLSGVARGYQLVLGALCATAVASLHTGHSALPFPWVRFVTYLPWLASRVILSALHVTRLILSPTLRLDPVLINYRPRLRQPGALVLMGNSITLTPGTITAELSRDELLIHALDNQSAQDVTSRALEQRIAQMFSDPE